MERAEKLRKLEATKRRVPAISASALAGLLQDIKAHGLPGLDQRKHVKEATVKALDMSSYGPLLECQTILGKGGKQVKVVFANFFTLLQGFFLQCEPFRLLLIDTIAAHGNKALNLCFYSDEVNPGNTLAIDQGSSLAVTCKILCSLIFSSMQKPLLVFGLHLPCCLLREAMVHLL